jgi:hypothetical protein
MTPMIITAIGLDKILSRDQQIAVQKEWLIDHLINTDQISF